MARMILLTKQVIDRMLADPEFHEFSFIKNPPTIKARTIKLPPQKKGCGGCRRKPKTRIKRIPAGTIDYNTIKQNIVGLSTEQLSAIKERLDCTSLKIQWRNHRNANERRVF